jgi:hypothetical protein
MQQGFSWKVGDKAFHEHKEVTIREIEDGRVTEVSDGYFSHGYWNFNDELFPVTEGGRKIVDFFHEQYDILHKLPGNRLFNWPDLARAIDQKFNDTMRGYHAGDAAEVIRHLYNAGIFFRQVHVWAARATGVTVDGIRLFNSNQ